MTGSGSEANCRILLPPGVTRLREATLDGRAVPRTIERVFDSHYAQVRVPLPGPAELRLILLPEDRPESAAL